jgi:hypothetical protein
MEDLDNTETGLAEAIMDGRKCQNTKQQYKRKYEHFRKWMKEKYPLCFLEDGLTVDLGRIEKSHFLDFFGHICKKKSSSGGYLSPIQYQSFQHVSGYKSAIKDHFGNMDHNLKDEIEKFLKNFFGGYMRKIANLKQDGEMSIVEGKMPLSFRGYKFLAEKAIMSHSICLILSLAIYLFTKGYDREGSKTTQFPGDAESKFSKWLRRICEANSETLRSQGVDISMIATHSFRKGVATFLSGTPGGPTAIAIYLRAGWSLGPVQSRYILEGEGGDQMCGRAATGLPITDVTFANLPAHILTLESGLTTAVWDDILPGYTTYYPLNFREVVPYLLASLVYHRSYLLAIQDKHPQHPLFLQTVWTSGILERLQDKVGAGCNRNPVSTMTATGVPPHLVLANQIVDMQKGMDVIRGEVISKLDGLPEALKRSMLQNFNINGTVPITHLQVVEMMEKLQSSIQTTIQAALIQNQSIATTEPTDMSSTGSETEIPSYRTWTWGSKIHPIPKGFRFPK